MAATSKLELLTLTEKEFDKLNSILDEFSPKAALTKREDQTSIKDVVGHRAHWIDLFLGWYKDGMAGKEVFFPAKGYKWNQLKAYNKDLRAHQAKLGWSEARAQLKQNHRKLVRLIENLSDVDLYAAPMKGANNDWTPGRWAEAAGPSHYRSASKFARRCLKEGTSV